ncbi:MAG: hypothetical protein JWP83_3793 [Mycobacterium sp.]|nr:hypothetical protein [Mycobacterium sp.]
MLRKPLTLMHDETRVPFLIVDGGWCGPVRNIYSCQGLSLLVRRSRALNWHTRLRRTDRPHSRVRLAC